MTHTPTDHTDQAVLRLKNAAHYLDVSLVTLWRLGETDETFPKKVIFSSRCVGYRKADLDAWLTKAVA